jgi:hypothetical protein
MDEPSDPLGRALPYARRVMPCAVLVIIAAVIAFVALFLVQMYKNEDFDCHTNMVVTIGVCQRYANRNGGKLPDHFEDLSPADLGNWKMRRCPGARRRGLTGPDYHFEQGLRKTDSPTHILFYDSDLRNHGGTGRYVAFSNLTFKWWPVKDEGKFQAKLASQSKELAESALPACPGPAKLNREVGAAGSGPE